MPFGNVRRNRNRGAPNLGSESELLIGRERPRDRVDPSNEKHRLLPYDQVLESRDPSAHIDPFVSLIHVNLGPLPSALTHLHANHQVRDNHSRPFALGPCSLTRKSSSS